jgi:hypothetical protein
MHFLASCQHGTYVAPRYDISPETKEDIVSVNRENIEKKKDEFKGGPEPGWQKMDSDAQRLAKENRPTGGDENPPPDWDDTVERSGDLTHPVGTESDSY